MKFCNNNALLCDFTNIQVSLHKSIKKMVPPKTKYVAMLQWLKGLSEVSCKTTKALIFSRYSNIWHKKTGKRHSKITSAAKNVKSKIYRGNLTESSFQTFNQKKKKKWSFDSWHFVSSALYYINVTWECLASTYLCLHGIIFLAIGTKHWCIPLHAPIQYKAITTYTEKKQTS